MVRNLRRFESIPIAMAALVTLSLPLPLRWWTLASAAATLAALTLIALHRVRWSVSNPAAAASLALAAVGAVVLGYAAYALVDVGVVGPGGRLGYPFLVATGLRLEGGVWLVLLCGLVSLVPLLFTRSG